MASAAAFARCMNPNMCSSLSEVLDAGNEILELIFETLQEPVYLADLPRTHAIAS